MTQPFISYYSLSLQGNTCVLFFVSVTFKMSIRISLEFPTDSSLILSLGVFVREHPFSRRSSISLLYLSLGLFILAKYTRALRSF